ncbi:mechanosensitive ion channel family protein [Cohaesibacter sp. ES.047]|uniref:mechanosensitive ion channel family protein n=1 Tax=Cohaesibacter sp. ES.047 TaxID=1798205 RepID=UPI0018D4E53C|nr:mechanosensitive ion channel family protein [Cohaesibacter sp. ES.047]
MRTVVSLAPNLLAAVIVIALTWTFAFIVGRLSSSLLRRSSLRRSLVEAITKVSRLTVWLVGALVAATLVFPNLTPTKLLAGLGLGSIAVGLAFKDIFENFLAGFLILLRKPMRIGDDIACGDLSGQVEHISIRDTFLRQRSGELILVPNSYLYKNPVKILTDRAKRRISLEVGIAYGEDVEAARKVISETVEALSTRETSRPFDIFTTSFGSSSIDFVVRWWTGSTPKEEHLSRSEAVSSIKTALDNAGIEIPFPYRTLTFKEPLKLSPDGEERS